MNRRLFNYIHLKENEENTILPSYLNDSILLNYYYKEDYVSQVAYLTYMNFGKDYDINNILIKKDNELVPLEEFSPIVKGFLHSGTKKETRIFYGIKDNGVKRYV
jgi:HD superfamily phosphohydrolase